MEERDAIASFLDKWRARWPEWAVAEVFVPGVQREPASAWMSLVQELTDAAWGGSDPRPGEAKLGWWVEELQGWSRGMRRHPLGQALQRFPAPWYQLAGSLAALRDSRERPLDARDARAQLDPFATAVAAVEHGLFGEGRPEALDVVAPNLLYLRLAHHPAAAAPLEFQARAGEAALMEWARHLAASAGTQGAVRPRRLLAGLARARLRRGEPARPLPMAQALLVSWRAARG